jgi:PAS domain-containing protein
VEKIAASEHRFYILIEKATFSICILKVENMIVAVANAAILSLWNADKEAIGKSLYQIIPEASEQVFAELLSDVFKTGDTHYGNEVSAYISRAGEIQETMYFNFVYYPCHEDDGTIGDVIVQAINVTEQVLARKKVEKSEAQLRTLIEAAPVAIGVFIGRDLIIENPSREFIDIVGKGSGIAGKRLTEVMPELGEHG